MKIVIVGNGVAGTFSAQNIRNRDKNIDIEIYSKEDYPYYSRIKLPELISDQITIDDLIAFKDDWYEKNNITYHLKKNIYRIQTKRKHFFIQDQKDPVSYDKLILALGSNPNIPPINKAFELIKKGVFTLRSIDDALEIQSYIKEKGVKKAIVIGGGLLGLELAKQIRNCNLDTTIVEFFPRLLPRQLDVECGNMLKDEIEEMGIKVILDATTEEILGNGTVKGIRLKDGREFKADIVLIQAGVRPTIDFARDANLNVNKGIVVNEYLETSEKDIFAVGDCIEYKNQTWGIIPACMEQSKIVAASVLGEKNVKYNGTIPKNTLKIVGIDLTSVGIYDPPDQENAGWEILKKIDKKSNCYQKIVLKDNMLKGAILFGEKKAVPYINKKINGHVDIKELKDLLELFTWICPGCKWEYDEAKMQILFKDLPQNWECIGCNGPKSTFKKKE